MKSSTVFKPAKLLASLSLTTALAVGFALRASAATLGIASDYNAFILEDINQSNTDIEGKLAVGGNINLSSFGVGDKVGSGDVLIAGGNLTLFNGQVNGNAIYGGTASLGGGANVTGTLTQGSPINFGEAGQYLRNLSTSLFNSVANGAKAVAFGGITLNGTDANLNVFNVSEAELESANSFTINAPSTSTAVINIAGSNLSIGGFGFTINGISRQRVLYNFYEASSLTSNSLGIQGSVLAPNAAFVFNNGEINGTLVARSLTGNGESHNFLFEGNLPEQPPQTRVPEPATLLGLGLVATALGVSRRKGIQKA